MTIFTVVITREPSVGAFQQMLISRFANDHLAIIPNVWLVAGKGTAQGMSDALGISDGSIANGVVSGMSSYYGRASTSIWDWVKAKWEETSASE
jgi:hypothetical protein